MTACDNMVEILMDGGSTFVADICNNVANFMKAFGSYIILIIGIALIIVSAYHVVKAFSARGNANWVLIIACLLFGGFLTFGGWKIITGDTFGGTGKETVDAMLDGSKPAAINDYAESGGASATAEKARKGLSNLANSFILPFGKALAVSVGVLLVVISVYQVGKFLFAVGRAQISWLRVAAMCIIGSCMFTATPTENDGGWEWVRDIIVSGAKESVETASEGQNQGEGNGLTPNDTFQRASGS